MVERELVGDGEGFSSTTYKTLDYLTLLSLSFPLNKKATTVPALRGHKGTVASGGIKTEMDTFSRV